MSLEVEIKLWVPSGLAEMRKRIKALKFKLAKRRVFEQNVLFDTADLSLRRSGVMIRIRRAGKLGILTFKGPSQPGPHKAREELESELDDPDTMELILARLGHQPVFRYEKFREEYERPGQHGAITLDETPIGNFLELEGAAKWIDRTARELGFSRADYITRSYGNLYLAYCREHGTAPSNMTFDRAGRRHTHQVSESDMLEKLRI
ncbi:MAG: class IV adenylate cyclase [Bryobacteraceae bacterium]